jgi:hypothetical protein
VKTLVEWMRKQPHLPNPDGKPNTWFDLSRVPTIVRFPIRSRATPDCSETMNTERYSDPEKKNLIVFSEQ